MLLLNLEDFWKIVSMKIWELNHPTYVFVRFRCTFYYCPRYSKTVAFPFSHGFFLKESYSLFKETNTRTGEENKNDIFLLNRFYFNKKKLRYSQNVLLFQNRKLTIKIFPRQNLLNYQRSLIYQRTFLNERPVTLKCYIVPDVLEKAIWKEFRIIYLKKGIFQLNWFGFIVVLYIYLY